MIDNTIINKSGFGQRAECRGFTLIELVISMGLMTFVLATLLKVLMDVSVVSIKPEFRNIQSMLAQELIEEIRGKRFDELTSKDGNGNWSTSLGVNTGETSGTKSTYDDVDDFNGFSETMSSPYAGFTRSVAVTYVAGSALTTNLTIPSPVGTNWTPNFKRVRVSVAHSAVPTLTLETIISSVNTG